jgi:hypothetical protein
MDDNDIARLYPVAHWRELPDELVESEYAAPSFLSPEGFRHFIPAYMASRCATWAAVPPPSPPKGAQRGRIPTLDPFYMRCM